MPSSEYGSLLQPVTLYSAMWLANGMLADVMQEEAWSSFAHSVLLALAPPPSPWERHACMNLLEDETHEEQGQPRIKVQPYKLTPMWQMFSVLSLTHTHTLTITISLHVFQLIEWAPLCLRARSDSLITGFCPAYGWGRLDGWRINTPQTVLRGLWAPSRPLLVELWGACSTLCPKAPRWSEVPSGHSSKLPLALFHILYWLPSLSSLSLFFYALNIISWDHLSSKLGALKSLSQDLLLGEPKLRQSTSPWGKNHGHIPFNMLIT